MKMDFAFLTVAVIICFLSVMARQNTTIFFTTTHSRTAPLKPRHYGAIEVLLLLLLLQKWIGLGQGQSFTCGSGWVESRKLDQSPTLYTYTHMHVTQQAGSFDKLP